MDGESDQVATSDSRESVREKARVLREQHRKKEKRNRLLLRGGLVVGALAVVATIALILITTYVPVGPAPRNMLSDGIRIAQGLSAVTTPAQEMGDEPVPHTTDENAEVLDIRIYVDYLCSQCSEFEDANGEQFEAWLALGAATVEIHPIAVLNSSSQGSQYSTRAANAAACVANSAPNLFWSVNSALFDAQPEVDTVGLSDDELIELVGNSGVSSTGVEECIRENTFKQWVQAATLRAQEGPLPDSNVDTVNPTGFTVIVNGLLYEGAPDDEDAFAAFVLQAAGNTFNEDSTATPTPTPGATGSPTPTPTGTATPSPTPTN